MGWHHKNCVSQEDAIQNAISFFQELGLGKLVCIENDYLESKLGNSENVLRVCEKVGALPLFDIAHYKLFEGKNWFETFLRFAEYWENNEPIIFHYSTTDEKGVHLPLDAKDFKECAKALLKLDNDIAIVLETPKYKRINDALEAKGIIMTLLNQKKKI